ncbi:HlyD family type I secretion periplasmic adaptor subunit [Piscinibacter sp. XHJ-5]|uniref:HlyD family type I secretion periplasmic adaptor subunit n=1 Tax=Piscinibacter sp. XHJ-5 TaxID=3037797 RepID=UPI002452CBB5|nr:HlyD family type I secretion periplasmic adaptor subunit [Piscinibacter sp. XHJ-5]
MNGSTMTPGGALADLLAQAAPGDDRRREWRADVRRLALPMAVAAALLAAWSATAPLAGAVIAPAQVKVELKRKTVQHQEGGIVREILVRDGQTVRAGDPLLVVGDLRTEADWRLLQDQHRAARARLARAEAESRLATRFEAPQDLSDEAAAGHVARERSVFAAHRQALDEQSALVQGQVQQAHAQAAALESQIAATGVSGKLSDEELAINESLASQGFVHRTRLIGLQRTSADYQSRLGEQRGELAAARQRIAELRARVAQLRIAYQTQATDEAKEAADRVREIEERLRPSKDQLERQVVRAPVDGEVMSLRVAGPGAAIAPREALLDVVPRHEKLVVEGRVEPHAIEHVHVGGTAEVRLVTADARDLPPLPATISFVSADRVTQPETGRAWYDVTVEVDARSLQRSPLRLQPGMPAELFVTTGERTLLAYLLKPLRAFSQRAMREPS